MSSKKTVLVVGVTADRMTGRESLCLQLGWEPEKVEVEVEHIKVPEFFLGLKQLLQRYEPSLWEQVSDDKGRIKRGTIKGVEEIALVDKHLEQLGTPNVYVIDSMAYIAQKYQPQSRRILKTASYRTQGEVYTLHYGGGLKRIK